jgi:hypothetical protein
MIENLAEETNLITLSSQCSTKSHILIHFVIISQKDLYTLYIF